MKKFRLAWWVYLPEIIFSPIFLIRCLYYDFIKGQYWKRKKETY